MIEIGDNWTFIPMAFTQSQPEDIRVRYQIPVLVTGKVEYIHREHGWFRVGYDCHGIRQHECFPLPYGTERRPKA